MVTNKVRTQLKRARNVLSALTTQGFLLGIKALSSITDTEAKL